MSAEATTLSHRDFESWVTCEGQPMPVYSSEVNGTKASCWIPSEAGKVCCRIVSIAALVDDWQGFAVHVKLSDTGFQSNLVARLFVDGSFIHAVVFGTVPPCRRTSVDIEGLRGPASIQKLYFSQLVTSGGYVLLFATGCAQAYHRRR